MSAILCSLITKTQQNIGNLYIRNQKTERVKNYNYLDSVINEKNASSEEIKEGLQKPRVNL